MMDGKTVQARLYDPYLNRWTQPDTIIPDYANPQSLNRYSYVYNSPSNFTDPTGHIACEDLGTEACNENGDYTNEDVSGPGGTSAYGPWKPMPLSGSERGYDPNSWNSRVPGNGEPGVPGNVPIESYNCYEYACNFEDNGLDGSTQDPGNFSGHEPTFIDIDSGVVDYNSGEIVGLTHLDAQASEIGFQSCSASEACPAGTYKVALVIDNEGGWRDYHWYMQNAEGFWSHKPGIGPVTNLDGALNPIWNPQTANRGSGDHNYDTFVGYYCVGNPVRGGEVD